MLYENFSCNTIKKLNALEISAIKMAYRLPRQTPTLDCLDYLKYEGIAERLQKKRDNFVNKNKSSPLIRHGETLKYTQGRRIRIKRIHKDRSLRHKGWKTRLHEHREHQFFSDLNTETNQDNHEEESIAIKQRKLSLREGHTATSPIRFPNQEITHIRFRIRPEYERRALFDPG